MEATKSKTSIMMCRNFLFWPRTELTLNWPGRILAWARRKMDVFGLENSKERQWINKSWQLLTIVSSTYCVKSS